MRVFAVSDIHADYQDNKQWLSDLSAVEYLYDILILAGDVTDNLNLLGECFGELAKKFLKVLFVPGNHELWVARDKTFTSFEKYHQICKVANEHGIHLQPLHIESLSIVPLLGWYDFSFASLGEKLLDSWMDFRACIWPNNLRPLDITQYFVEKNEPHLQIANQTLISFSHFLPRIDLMPEYIPQAYHYLYPILGSTLIEKQIRLLKPKIHVYGHSHVNRQVTLDGIQYINNAFGCPSKGRIARKNCCVYMKIKILIHLEGY